MRIGLYGGSFNPAHAGHLHVSRTALRRLRLDRVWWLVTPGNPLKDRTSLAPLDERVSQARRIASDPRIAVTGFETTIGSRYTVETLSWLARRRTGLRFVWIMGADSLSSFHRWRSFETIMREVPVAVIDRPGHTLTAPMAKAARIFATARVPEAEAVSLASRRPPSWTFLHGPRSELSSTALRKSHDTAFTNAP